MRLGGGSGRSQVGPGAPRARSAWLAPSARAPDAHAPDQPRVITCLAGGWLWVAGGHARLNAVRRRLRALAGAPGRPQARSAWLGPWARAPDAHTPRRPRVVTRLRQQVCARDTRGWLPSGGGGWHPQVRLGAPLARSAWPRPTPPAPDPRRPCSRAPHLCCNVRCVQARATRSQLVAPGARYHAPRSAAQAALPGAQRLAQARTARSRPAPRHRCEGGHASACVRACMQVS